MTMVTGVMAEPVIERFARIIRKVERLDVQVKPIKNCHFGEDVTVTSLLGGKEVLAELKTLQENGTLGKLVILPEYDVTQPE